MPTTEQASPSSTAAPLARPLVAIVGQPNVGKSSLFNRLAGQRLAIVSEVAGTTRDRISAEVVHGDTSFLIVDTGGLVANPESSLETQVIWQVDAAVTEADLVVLLTDVTRGITPGDLEAAEHLRRSGRPVVLACNKVDRPVQISMATELNELGLGEPIAISAYHAHGMDDLLDAMVKQLPPGPVDSDPGPQIPHLAIVGRPNVGKSTLANALLGHERSIVSDVPGTTRDAVDTHLEYEGRSAVLIDTAGIRRRGSVAPGIERYSVMRAIRAIDRCDVALLVLDGTELVTAQDRHIAGMAMESFKGMVAAVNKWDLVPEAERDEAAARHYIRKGLHFMEHIPIRFISAAEHEGLDPLMQAAFRVEQQRRQWVAPERLQAIIMGAIAEHLPPKHGSRTMKIYRVKQEKVGPPTFVFYCNNPSLMHFSYERYLENVLRRGFGFQGTHLRLEFRGKGKIHVIGGHRAGGRRTAQ
jgi:GTP-binding protein